MTRSPSSNSSSVLLYRRANILSVVSGADGTSLLQYTIELTSDSGESERISGVVPVQQEGSADSDAVAHEIEITSHENGDEIDLNTDINVKAELANAMKKS